MSHENEWFEGLIAESEDELRWRRRWVARAALLLALVIAGAIVSAHAADVFRDKDDLGGPAVYRLSDKPCTHPKVLAHLRGHILDDRRFKAGTLTWHGKDWASCWIEIRGTVHSIDEEGSPFSPVLRKLFRDESI